MLPIIKKPFSWSPEADTAFRMLKERFTSIPILWIPDPALQFVVEVDKLDIGVGTVTESRLRRFIPAPSLAGREKLHRQVSRSCLL